MWKNAENIMRLKKLIFSRFFPLFMFWIIGQAPRIGVISELPIKYYVKITDDYEKFVKQFYSN